MVFHGDMDRDTRFYFASYGLSLLGNGVASAVFPLLVLARTGDVLAAGLIAGVTTGVAAVVGVLGGVIIDRFNRRNVSIVSDVISAAAIASLPLIDATIGLNLTWFIVIAFLGALGDVPGMTAREALLPKLVVDGGKLDRMIGIRESVAALMLLVGPGLGGVIVWIFGVGSLPFIFTTLTSFTAALLTFGIGADKGKVDWEPLTITGVVSDMLVGGRFLLHHRLVFSITMLSCFYAAVIVALQTVLVPAYFLEEAMPHLSGVTLSGFALGGFVGAGIYSLGVDKVSRRTFLVIGITGFSIGFAVIGGLFSPWIMLAATVFIGVTNGPLGAVLGTVMIEAIPDKLRGRVMGMQNAFILAIPSLAAMIFAAVAKAQGLAWAGAALIIVVVVVGILSLASRTLRTLETAA